MIRIVGRGLDWQAGASLIAGCRRGGRTAWPLTVEMLSPINMGAAEAKVVTI